MAPTLRPRTAKTCPVNGYVFSSSFKKKKVIKQQKKRHVRISNDDLVDAILLFLTRRQLFKLQFVNRRLKRLIDSGMEKNQLQQKLCLKKLIFSVYSL
jgi:hypothetical protein